jgi:phospholipid-translocating ATPase
VTRFASQSAIIFFILLYSYFSPSARHDGYDVSRVEFSTTMVIAAATAANLFNGLNTRVWTRWVFFSVFIGIVLVWVYTVRGRFFLSFLCGHSNTTLQALYSLIAPGWFATPVYGNDHYLFQSPIFWFGNLITILLALLPRYLYIAWTFGFRPNDLDILNWNYKYNPKMDPTRVAQLYSEPEEDAHIQEDPTTPHSATSGPVRRSSMQASQIDMSTGMRSQSRGYSFAQEENGVAMRRMQSNLSGASPHPKITERKSRLFHSIRHLRRKQPPSGGDDQGESRR